MKAEQIDPLALAMATLLDGKTYSSTNEWRQMVARAMMTYADLKSKRSKQRFCDQWCGKRCPDFGKDHCFHDEKHPNRWCTKKCRDARRALSPKPRKKAVR